MRGVGQPTRGTADTVPECARLSSSWEVTNPGPAQVVPCCKRFVHDWSDCPFSHPGEKARRRDPKQFNYTGIACPDMKKVSLAIRGAQQLPDCLA